MRYLIYNKATGQIERTLMCNAEHLVLNVMEGESSIPCPVGVSDDNHWVDHATGTAHPKGDYPLDALPLPCTVTIEGTDYVCAAQPEFEFDAPGSYTVTVDAGPRYLKKEFTIENPA